MAVSVMFREPYGQEETAVPLSERNRACLYVSSSIHGHSQSCGHQAQATGVSEWLGHTGIKVILCILELLLQWKTLRRRFDCF